MNSTVGSASSGTFFFLVVFLVIIMGVVIFVSLYHQHKKRLQRGLQSVKSTTKAAAAAAITINEISSQLHEIQYTLDGMLKDDYQAQQNRANARIRRARHET